MDRQCSQCLYASLGLTSEEISAPSSLYNHSHSLKAKGTHLLYYLLLNEVPLHTTSSLEYRVLLGKLIISAFYWAPQNGAHNGSISGLSA